MVKADLNKIGYSQIITYQRPNIDGYEKDVQFSLQVQNSNYQRRQAQASESSANSAVYQNIQNMNRNNQLQQQNYQLQNINNYMRYGY
jgi:PDZ domain-containing secreted protein